MTISDMHTKLQSQLTQLDSSDSSLYKRLSTIVSRLKDLTVNYGSEAISSEIETILKNFSPYSTELLREIENYLSKVDEATASGIKGVSRIGEDEAQEPKTKGQSLKSKLIDFLPFIIGIVVLAVGLSLGLTVFNEKQDTLYFVLESIKDLSASVISGFSTQQIINHKKGKRNNIAIVISGAFLGLLALTFSMVLCIGTNFAFIERFTHWGKLSYFWMVISLIVVSIICAISVIVIGFLLIYHPHKKKRNNLRKKSTLISLIITVFLITIATIVLSVVSFFLAFKPLEYVEAKAPTCVEDGNKSYYRNPRNELFYADNKGEKELKEDEVFLPALGHSLKHHSAELPTCMQEGHIEYWQCTRCGKYFSDAYGNFEISDNEIISEKATGHFYDVNNKCSICGESWEYTKGLSYELNSDGNSYSVTGIGIAADKHIVIPLGYDGKPVTKIGEEAFGGKATLTSIAVPEGVTTIGSKAFVGCSALSEITIPGSVTMIGDCAFMFCGRLCKIIISDGVQHIGEMAFLGAGLESINIPQSVDVIDDFALSCPNLISITVDERNPRFKSENNCLLEKDGKTLLRGCSNGFIPQQVKVIGATAFAFCGDLRSINIPQTVSKINNSAFNSCPTLTNVIIPNSVTSIGDSAFHYCKELKSLIIPDSVTSIGNSCFSSCEKLEDVKISRKLREIPASAFSDCGLTSVEIPDSVIWIQERAFESCENLLSVTVGSSVRNIGQYAFEFCNNLSRVKFKMTDEWYAEDENYENEEFISSAELVNESSAADIIAYYSHKRLRSRASVIIDGVETWIG